MSFEFKTGSWNQALFPRTLNTAFNLVDYQLTSSVLDSGSRFKKKNVVSMLWATKIPFNCVKDEGRNLRDINSSMWTNKSKTIWTYRGRWDS